jgi:gas vesicle protein
MKTQSSTTMLTGLSLCAGALIGVGTGVLFAPRSGERTRRKIKDFVEDAGEHLDEKRSEAKRSVTRLFNRISSSCRIQPRKRIMANFRLSPGWLNHHSQKRTSMVS